MYPELQGQVAVVTGAASGLGYGIAQRFLEEGMNVVINYHSDKRREHAEELAARYNEKAEGGKFRAIAAQADVSTESDVGKLRQAAIEVFGRLDVWVNNAGLEARYPSHKLPKEAWDKTIAVNLTGTFLGSREALAHFVDHDVRGSIINLSSVHEAIPWPTFSDYATTKSGVMMYTKSIALEYARLGIRVNCIAPGAIETPINAEKFDNPELRGRTENMIPMHRIGKVSDVANAAAWLASGQSRYVTGHSLFVDGGMSLYPSFERGDG